MTFCYRFGKKKSVYSRADSNTDEQRKMTTATRKEHKKIETNAMKKSRKMNDIICASTHDEKHEKKLLHFYLLIELHFIFCFNSQRNVNEILVLHSFVCFIIPLFFLFLILVDGRVKIQCQFLFSSSSIFLSSHHFERTKKKKIRNRFFLLLLFSAGIANVMFGRTMTLHKSQVQRWNRCDFFFNSIAICAKVKISTKLKWLSCQH